MTHHTPEIESPSSPDDPDSRLLIFGGVDTHLDFHVVAAVNALGALLATAVFPTTIAGYRDPTAPTGAD